jgi:hypothetical protein
VEGEALLDHILENTPLLEPLRVEPELSQKEVSSAKVEPIISLERASPKPSDLSYFEDELFEEFGNTSKYLCQKRPLVLVTPLEPLLMAINTNYKPSI